MEDVNVQDPAAPSQARGASHTASTSSAAESGDGDVDDGKGIPSSLTPQEGSPEKDTTPAASQEETSSTTVGDAVESATPTPASSLAPAAADDDEEEQSTHPAATEAEGVDRVDQEGGGDTTITSSAGPHQGTGTDDGAAAATSHHNDSTNLNRLVLEKYAMYKTESRLYVIASNQSDSRYRVLKIDRHYSQTDKLHELGITEDATIYSKQEVSELLHMIEDGNKTSGGLQKVVSLFYGIVGFIRFTAGWYIVLIKQRAAVGLIGGHYIYHCEESIMVPVSNNAKPEKISEENRLYNAFQQVDLSKNFYFSYSYDLTSTLQSNLTRAPAAHKGVFPRPSTERPVHWMADHAFHEPRSLDPASNVAQAPLQNARSAWGFNDKFVWNHFLLKAAFADNIQLAEGQERSCWVLPLIHGYVDQSKLSVFGRTVYVTLIARRSRYFAGARFLKRGVNDEGNVANDVETEQIVSDALTTSFYAPATESDGIRRPHAVPRYTSYVQHRGSIPLSWQQDTSTSSLKPPIHLHLIDPYHSAAALHFDDLFARYGSPIIALNLIKRKEHEPREMKLVHPYKECIDYLNQFLPEAKKIRYIPFDMSAAYKNRTMDVIGVLEDIAEEVIETTKFFHSGPEPMALARLDDGSPNPAYRSEPLLQEGVCRSNCIDCLDRTNAAQFVIAKAAFGHQLHALGILANPHLTYDNDAVNMLTEMYHDHGDTIALQYGGSHLVNTMNTYRKINQWTSHSRDMIEGIKRFYANVALDQDKQNSINLFLGIDVHDAILTSPANPAAALVQKVAPSLTTTGSPVGPPNNALPAVAVDYEETSQQMEKADRKEEGDGEEMEPDDWELHVRRRDYRHWYTPEFVEQRLEADEILRRMTDSAEEDGNYWLEYYRPKLFTQLERHFAYKVNSTTRYNPRLHGHYTHDPNDLSPFKDRPVILHHPPKLGVGVRRWMSVQKKAPRPSSTARAVNARQVEEDETTPEDEPPLPPASTTEGLALRLLKPKVSSAETAEYASYVDQFRNLNLSNELHYESSAGDMLMYEQAIKTASGKETAAGMMTVDPATEEIYEKHCRAVREQRAAGLYGGDGHAHEQAELSF